MIGICAGDKIEKNEMGWACGTYGRREGVYRVLVGKPEGRSPLGGPRRRWVDNIWMDLQEVGCGYMVADACECGNEPSGSVKCGEFLD